ncbi:hypothetical protein AC249_AIPGENE12379 [Exaiptasia diaphana]|nr:hypothetical protein AC249_AIPGENE12379 [Exaiptasia diaphana]
MSGQHSWSEEEYNRWKAKNARVRVLPEKHCHHKDEAGNTCTLRGMRLDIHAKRRHNISANTEEYSELMACCRTPVVAATSTKKTRTPKNTSTDLSSRRSALNKFLSISGVEFIPLSKKSFSELQHRTKMNHVSKTSEVITAVLDVIAPGDAGALWEATKKSKLVEHKLAMDVEHQQSKIPHVVQDIPFGQRNLRLSNGKIVEAPNIIREMVKERTIKQYLQFCKEENFKPFSYATMHRILTSCTASVRKSLQGLDYISAEGSSAFHDLSLIIHKLSEHNLHVCEGQKLQRALKDGKQYLKTDYKIYLNNNKRHYLYPDSDDDLPYCYQTAVQAIDSWKAHLLRSDKQDKARTDILDALDENSVLITQDWAMKFLPQKYRETQADWFAKRGISWHISVAVRKVDNALQHQTLIHVVKTSPQETDTGTWIMENVLATLKKEYPEINVAYFRQDNAGCYHSVALVSSCPQISLRTGIHIKRVDFSDPQGGKGACDRKAATVKGHVRRFINEGHNVDTAEDFKNAVLSHGGINGVRVALVDYIKCDISVEGKWDDISSLNNFSFDENGKKVTVWKSYDVGEGKCRLRKEKLTLLDQAKVMYAEKLSEGSSAQPSLPSVSSAQATLLLSQGWALKQTKKAVRFSEKQTSYLDEKFLIGQSTGIKADPSQVACDFRNARTESGQRRFTIDEFLTPQQIKSYFSRKAAKNKQVDRSTEQAQKDHQSYALARDTIIQECQIQHPIMCDTYDLCHLHSKGKLEGFKVDLLRHFCIFFNMDVDGLSHHRKAPYVSILKELVLSCTCTKS